jgi:hypothetical protein
MQCLKHAPTDNKYLYVVHNLSTNNWNVYQWIFVNNKEIRTKKFKLNKIVLLVYQNIFGKSLILYLARSKKYNI